MCWTGTMARQGWLPYAMAAEARLPLYCKGEERKRKRVILLSKQRRRIVTFTWTAKLRRVIRVKVMVAL